MLFVFTERKAGAEAYDARFCSAAEDHVVSFAIIRSCQHLGSCCSGQKLMSLVLVVRFMYLVDRKSTGSSICITTNRPDAKSNPNLTLTLLLNCTQWKHIWI